MADKNYICGGNKFTYGKAYIAMPLFISDLPETVNINGEILYRKTEFHISLICVRNILDRKTDAERVVLDTFCSFVNEKDISLIKYTGEFRLAHREEKKSIVALCDVSNLRSLFRLLETKLGMEIPDQPTHVTLYTLQPDKGIGLNSKEELERESVAVEAPLEVKKALSLPFYENK